MFATEIIFFNPLPLDIIRRLRKEGDSLSKIAKQTGINVSAVRRAVGRQDRAAIQQRQEEVAIKIAAEALSVPEKIARWKAETGKSWATYWRVLRRSSQHWQ